MTGPISDGKIIATLPAGFRPSGMVEFPATFSVSDGRMAGTSIVHTDGLIEVHVNGTAAGTVFLPAFCSVLGP